MVEYTSGGRVVARSSRVIPTILEGSWETGSLFFDYELQITNYGKGRNLFVVRCAVRTDSVCVCVSDSFFLPQRTPSSQRFLFLATISRKGKFITKENFLHRAPLPLNMRHALTVLRTL